MAYPVSETNSPIDLQPGGTLVSSAAVGSWAESDREIYGTRFNLLLQEGRSTDTSYNGSMRPYKITNNFWHVPSFGSIYSVPNPIPATNNQLTSSGTNPTSRGGLICRAYAQNARVEFGIRKVVLDGTGGLSTAGSWTTAFSTHGASFQWKTASSAGFNYLRYPTGITSGELIQLYVAFRHNGTYGGTPSYLAGYEVFEPNLGNANP